MEQPDLDDESIPRYKRGYEWFSHLANADLSRRPWKRLGIFSFYDAPFAESDLLYLSPKQVMLTMARMAKTKESGLVLVVDALEKDDRPSVREMREDIEKEVKETKDHILSLRERLGDALKRKFTYLPTDWEGADIYNNLMEKALNNVADSVNKSTKSFQNTVANVCEMADRMNH